MKVVKYILGILFIFSSLGAIIQGSFLAFLFLMILGLVFLPPISDLLKEKFKFWQNKAVRYVSYIVLFFIAGVFMPNDLKNIGAHDKSENSGFETEKINSNKILYPEYQENSERLISSLSDQEKLKRKEALEKLYKNSFYKILVDSSVVSAEYIPLINGISNGISYINSEKKGYAIEQELVERIEKMPNGNEAMDFVFFTTDLVQPHYGGMTKELIEVFERYRKKYNYYGESSSLYDASGKQLEKIQYSYDFSSIFGVLDSKDEKVLNAIYEAKQKGLSRWCEEGDYAFAYISTKKEYNSYLKQFYPASSYLVDMDIEISAKQLYAEYEANEVAADNKFKGKKVAVSGVIGSIGKDVLDKPYISLEIGYLQSVNCYFSNKHNEEISSLKKGQKITIIGICEGKSLGIMVTIDECKVLE